ncbi:ABC transporter permease [Comamonadaceae bacterium G21597-S1]|nr:ABC transporter permease [Comamonadaceae bacterium G21597-S1]
MRLSTPFVVGDSAGTRPSRGASIVRTGLNRLPTLRQLIAFAMWAAFGAAQVAYAQTDASNCGSLANSYGPYDYRTERTGKLHVVEAYHFTPNIEGLVRGNSGSLGAELNYTLRASPNHHRALMAMVKLVDRLKTDRPMGSDYSIDCWFNRALRFQPDDLIVRMIFATYLASRDRKPDAIEQLEIAASAAGDNAFTHFNIGLVYFDLKEYERALVQAHKSTALGFQRTTLQDLLQKAGQWKEPADKAPPPGTTKATP